LDRLSVYKTYVKFADGSGEKLRPIVILVDDSDNFSSDRTALAIYSSKERFNNERTRDFYAKILYEIKDPGVAGLNKNLTSYVNVAEERLYPFRELMEEAEFLGELSARDSFGVMIKYNEYYSS